MGSPIRSLQASFAGGTGGFTTFSQARYCPHTFETSHGTDLTNMFSLPDTLQVVLEGIMEANPSTDDTIQYSRCELI